MRRSRKVGRGSGLARWLESSIMLLALTNPATLVDRDEEQAGLAVTCPHCGRSVPFPARTRTGALCLAECEECDIYFEAEDVEPRDPKR